MPTEVPTKDGQVAAERVASIIVAKGDEALREEAIVAAERVAGVIEPKDDEALRVEAIEQIHRERRFKTRLVVLTLVMLAVGASWVLTEYYTAHSTHAWPSSFADAPADRPGVWSTWFFYFVGVCFVLLAIDAYRTYAKPYLRRTPTRAEIDRKIERLRPGH